MNKLFAVFILAVFLTPLLVLAAAGHSDHSHSDAEMKALTGAGTADIPENSNYKTAVLYYNEACGMCKSYLTEELIPLLNEMGIKNIVMKDYINEKQNRVELNELNDRYGIPAKLKGHFMIFIDDKIVLAGHVPKDIVKDLLSTQNSIERFIVYQDEMDEPKSYIAWGFRGEPKEYSIGAPISDYISWFDANKNTLQEPSFPKSSDWLSLLPIVLSSGLFDGINPCAFAVLLFFIAFLYTLHKTRVGIWKLGIVYIFAIFLAYLLIGLGLLKTFIFSGSPHFMAKLGAWLIIGLGGINVVNFLLPDGKKLNLGIPSFAKEPIKKWMYKATIPAAFILGFLVGICEFPCSGGIYVAIVGLLAVKTTFLQGLWYLAAYNLMFVVPLIVILFAASSKTATEKLSLWERSQSKIVKLVSGLVMLALGIIILLWFVH